MSVFYQYNCSVILIFVVLFSQNNSKTAIGNTEIVIFLSQMLQNFSI